MHSRAGGVHWIEYDEVTRTISPPLKTNNSKRVTRLLKIDWRQKSLVYIRAITDGSLGKVSLDSGEECFMGFYTATFVVAEHFYRAVDL